MNIIMYTLKKSDLTLKVTNSNVKFAKKACIMRYSLKRKCSNLSVRLILFTKTLNHSYRRFH